MNHELKRRLPLAVLVFGLVGLTGCGGVLPAHLEGKLASNGSADDHMAAAMLYQNKATQLEAKADRYEILASKIGVHEDPKGFRRGALVMAAQENRTASKEMHELYASHFEKAQTMYGKKSPE
ncbi:hypothetical protein [Petrachloros mirabilis]